MTNRRSASEGSASPTEPSITPPFCSSLRRAAVSSRRQPSPRRSSNEVHHPARARRAERGGQLSRVVSDRIGATPDQQCTDRVLHRRVGQLYPIVASEGVDPEGTAVHRGLVYE